MTDNSNKNNLIEWDLFDFFLFIKENIKKISLFFLIIFLIISLIYIFFPSKYKCSTSLLIDDSFNEFNALLSSAAPLLGNIGQESSQKGHIMAILLSRKLSENVINTLDLKKEIFSEYWDDTTQKWLDPFHEEEPSIEKAAKVLLKGIEISENPDNGLISLNLKYKDLEYCPVIANTYIDELKKYLDNTAITKSQRNKEFIESQLYNIQEKLLIAGKQLANFYKANSISPKDSKVDVDVYNSLLLSERERQNRENLEKIVSSIPQQTYLNYLQSQKNVLNKLVTLLADQYELAKIEEENEKVSFTQLDRAILSKSTTKLSLMIALPLIIIISSIISVGVVLFIEKLKLKNQE